MLMYVQYAEDRYNIEVVGVNLFQLKKAISSGADNGVFVLPKGLSGKVKLPPKKASTATKEVCRLSNVRNVRD